ncbi:MAG TPA: aldo/keto reductase [Actinomycetota bacterium]|jgi:aryl-alcohol dehydrogenase-like predicted oxidoreductase|nr:aldo/keto reductase [Actinomycetota bacterium]
MEMRKLGSQGPEISVIGYGAWEAGGDFWGPNESDEMVIAAIQAGLESGMNWIDTAEVYGKGHSEELVGKAVSGRRDETFLFTKVAPRPEGTGFRPDQVKQALQASLQRLGTDHVDLYQLHWPDRSVPLEETWGAMAGLQDEGLALHIGVSNVSRSMVERCLDIRHVDSVQNQFSLLNQEDRDDLLPSLSEWGVGYLAYSPLGLGILSGTITRDTQFHPQDFRGGARGSVPENFKPRNLASNLSKVEKLRPIAKRLGTTLAPLALRWVVEQTGVSAAIAGSRKADHVRSNATAGDLRLDRQTLDEIDSIFR